MQQNGGGRKNGGGGAVRTSGKKLVEDWKAKGLRPGQVKGGSLTDRSVFINSPTNGPLFAMCLTSQGMIELLTTEKPKIIEGVVPRLKTEEPEHHKPTSDELTASVFFEGRPYSGRLWFHTSAGWAPAYYTDVEKNAAAVRIGVAFRTRLAPMHLGRRKMHAWVGEMLNKNRKGSAQFDRLVHLLKEREGLVNALEAAAPGMTGGGKGLGLPAEAGSYRATVVEGVSDLDNSSSTYDLTTGLNDLFDYRRPHPKGRDDLGSPDDCRVLPALFNPGCVAHPTPASHLSEPTWSHWTWAPRPFVEEQLVLLRAEQIGAAGMGGCLARISHQVYSIG